MRFLHRWVCGTVAALLVLGTLVKPALANPDPPAWSSFVEADLAGIYLSPGLVTGTTNYTLTLDPAATITLGSSTYQINWIAGYFVVARDENAQQNFTATEGTVVTDWKWEEKANPGQIAGWVGTGDTRMLPASYKALGFGTFNINGTQVLSGLHIGYQTAGGELTGWYKDTLPQVPEPGSMLTLLCGSVGLLAVRKRR